MLLANVSRSRKPFGQSAFHNYTVDVCATDKTSLATSYLKVITKTNSVTEDILKENTKE